MASGYNFIQIYDNVITLFNFTYSIEYIFHNYVGGGYVSKFYIFNKILNLPEYEINDTDIIKKIFKKYLEYQNTKIFNKNNKIIIKDFLLKKIKNLKLENKNNEYILNKEKISNEEDNILDLIQFKNKYLKLRKKLNYCRSHNKYLGKFHLTNLESLYVLIYIFLPVLLTFNNRFELFHHYEQKSYNLVIKRLKFYIYNNEEFYNMYFNLKIFLLENFLFNKVVQKIVVSKRKNIYNNVLEFNQKFINKQYTLSTFINYLDNCDEFIEWLKAHNIDPDIKFTFDIRELNLKNEKLIYMPNCIYFDKKFNGFKMNAIAYYQDEKFIIYLSKKCVNDLSSGKFKN